jgi:hypothetical protein
MTTANALSRGIKDLLNGLLARNLILLPNAVIVVDGARVTWRSPAPAGKFVDFVDYPTIRTYRRWTQAGQYSALLPDAALLQLTYDVAHGEIAGHRLAYVPCPYRVDQDFLLTEAIGDVLDLHAAEPQDDITMQSAIRLDFDPGSAAVGHPTSHLTLNVSTCRIACEAPMAAEDFVRFVFRNFYKDQYAANVDFFEALPKSDRDSTVTEDERYEPHVAWRRRG